MGSATSSGGRATWCGFANIAESNRSTVGYLVGVSAGALAFWLIAALIVWCTAGFGNTSSLRFGLAHYAFVVIVALAALSLWVLASWALVIFPFLLVRYIARSLSISAAIYYVACGAVIGLLLCGLHELVSQRWRAGEPLASLDRVIALTGYGLGGAVGAFVFWWIAVRLQRPSPPR
jgi:hypothetical protein